MGVENGILWSEIGSGFGEPSAKPHQEFPGVATTPRGQIRPFNENIEKAIFKLPEPMISKQD